MPKTAIIVPCRLESTRFPRKLLHPVRGKPLLLWVAERIAAQAPGLPLHFAVDHELLAAPLRAAGFAVVMTDPRHPSGTDRLAEANRTIRADRVINVQADEPLVTAAQLGALATLIAGRAPMATLATPFRTAADFLNPNQVKVVFSGTGILPVGLGKASEHGQDARATPSGGRALYFSRAPIPFARDRPAAWTTPGCAPIPASSISDFTRITRNSWKNSPPCPPAATSRSKNSNSSACWKTATTSSSA